jgi:DNA-binding SARP family transcriptional activator
MRSLGTALAPDPSHETAVSDEGITLADLDADLEVQTRAERPGHALPGSDVHVYLLDGFQLFHRGEPVEVPMSAQRLIAFLALQDRPVLRVHVAGNLWTDKTDDRAAANLRSALWRLRRPGLVVVQTMGSRLRLAPGVSVDVHVAITRARAILDGTLGLDDELDATVLAADLLPDFYDDDFITLARERLRQLRLHALEATAELLVERNRVAQAIDVALAAVAAEPLRESAHRTLIRAHLREGNRAEALHQYSTYRRLLADELGVTPSPEMHALVNEAMEVVSVEVDATRPRCGVDATATGPWFSTEDSARTSIADDAPVSITARNGRPERRTRG